MNARNFEKAGSSNFEVDHLLQALNLVPEDLEHTLQMYKDLNYFMTLQSQAIPVGSVVSLEQSSEVPQQTPQFTATAKVVQVPVIASNIKDYYSLGSVNNRFRIWRP